jgi:hypothetical protein
LNPYRDQTDRTTPNQAVSVPMGAGAATIQIAGERR